MMFLHHFRCVLLGVCFCEVVFTSHVSEYYKPVWMFLSVLLLAVPLKEQQ